MSGGRSGSGRWEPRKSSPLRSTPAIAADGSHLLRLFALAEDQHDVAHIDQRCEPLAEDDHGLALHKAIDERHQPSDHRENPERERHDALAGALARDPLHDEATREGKLRDQAERQPEVELVPKDLPEIIADRGTELNEHQRTSETSGTRRLRRMSHHTPARSRIPTHSRSHMP